MRASGEMQIKSQKSGRNGAKFGQGFKILGGGQANLGIFGEHKLTPQTPQTPQTKKRRVSQSIYSVVLSDKPC